MRYNLHFRWTISRARDTEGYNICTLLVDDTKVAACNGGGYDMQGTCLGSWIAGAFPKHLSKLGKKFYGLSWHNPNFNPGKAMPDGSDKTVDEVEAEGTSLGLDRYQQFHKASSDTPTAQHTIPLIDGGCGIESVRKILEAIGGTFHHVGGSKNHDYYMVELATPLPGPNTPAGRFIRGIRALNSKLEVSKLSD